MDKRKRAEEVARHYLEEVLGFDAINAEDYIEETANKFLQFSKEESEKVLSDSIEGWVYQDDLDGDIIITVNVGKESKSPFKLKTIPVRIVYDKSLVR